MIRSFIHRGHGLYDNFWQSIKRNIDLNRFSFYKIIFLSHYIPKNPKIRNEKLKKKNFDILSRPNGEDKILKIHSWYIRIEIDNIWANH